MVSLDSDATVEAHRNCSLDGPLWVGQSKKSASPDQPPGLGISRSRDDPEYPRLVHCLRKSTTRYAPGKAAITAACSPEAIGDSRARNHRLACAPRAPLITK
jgi:hypothetical protein